MTQTPPLLQRSSGPRGRGRAVPLQRRDLSQPGRLCAAVAGARSERVLRIVQPPRHHFSLLGDGQAEGVGGVEMTLGPKKGKMQLDVVWRKLISIRWSRDCGGIKRV